MCRIHGEYIFTARELRDYHDSGFAATPSPMSGHVEQACVVYIPQVFEHVFDMMVSFETIFEYLFVHTFEFSILSHSHSRIIRMFVLLIHSFLHSHSLIHSNICSSVSHISARCIFPYGHMPLCACTRSRL